MDDTADATGETADGRDARWGLCSAFACPLPGTVKRGEALLCCCHAEGDAGANDAVTRLVRSRRAVYTATLDVRAHVGADDWPQVYRAVQQRLLDAGYADLLPCELDASPYQPGRALAKQWLARLERFLLDTVRDGLRQLEAQAKATTGAARYSPPLPSSRDCAARMRAALASTATRVPSAQWAFDLLDGIAENPASAPPPEAIRIALDAVASSAGRACVERASEAQRARWRCALEAISGAAAALVPSRVPGEDDEEPEREEA